MKIIEHIFNLLAPRDCLVCGKEGQILCSWCKDDAIEPVPSRCYRCKALTQGFVTCSKCRSSSSLNHVWVVGTYMDVPKKLVRHLKYDQYRDVASVIAKTMDEIMPPLPKDAILVPVPAVNSHVRVRGFDQSVLIAKKLSHIRKLSYVEAISRTGKMHQVGATAQQRHEQLREALRVRRPKLIKDAKILLVDDVLTTGASLELCAAALRSAGAKSVSAVVFAQAVRQ